MFNFFKNFFKRHDEQPKKEYLKIGNLNICDDPSCRQCQRVKKIVKCKYNNHPWKLGI